jgi:hypothetical protein
VGPKGNTITNIIITSRHHRIHLPLLQKGESQTPASAPHERDDHAERKRISTVTVAKTAMTTTGCSTLILPVELRVLMVLMQQRLLPRNLRRDRRSEGCNKSEDAPTHARTHTQRSGRKWMSPSSSEGQPGTKEGGIGGLWRVCGNMRSPRAVTLPLLRHARPSSWSHRSRGEGGVLDGWMDACDGSVHALVRRSHHQRRLAAR